MSEVVRHRDHAVHILEKGEGNNRISITTRSPDLAGDRIFPEGGDFATYLKNPVVLYGHNTPFFVPASGGIPIGRTKELERESDGIVADFDFLLGDPFADRVKNAWDQGFLRSASIGFVVVKSRSNEFGGFDISQWRLMEWSLVPVPMNPDALRRGLKHFGLEENPRSHAEELLDIDDGEIDRLLRGMRDEALIAPEDEWRIDSLLRRL